MIRKVQGGRTSGSKPGVFMLARVDETGQLVKVKYGKHFKPLILFREWVGLLESGKMALFSAEMQSDWDEYGPEAFMYVVLENMPDEVLEIEKYKMRFLKRVLSTQHLSWSPQGTIPPVEIVNASDLSKTA